MIWALHGAVGMSADWRDFASNPMIKGDAGELRKLDLWRFLDCCPMPLSQVGDTLAEEITRIDPAPVLLAYSMGGRLALHALLARPDAWKGAIIVSAHTGLNDEAEKAERREKDATWSALALKSDWTDFLSQWEGQSILSSSDSLPDRLQLKTRRASIARSFIDWSLGAQQNLLDKLPSIHCPVLWVTGQSDEKFTRVGSLAEEKLADGDHQIVPDCGHRVPWEKPEQFVGLCSSFISGL